MGQISISVDGTLVPKSGVKTFARSVTGGDTAAHKQAYVDARAFIDEAEAELAQPADAGGAEDSPNTDKE